MHELNAASRKQLRKRDERKKTTKSNRLTSRQTRKHNETTRGDLIMGRKTEELVQGCKKGLQDIKEGNTISLDKLKETQEGQ